VNNVSDADYLQQMLDSAVIPPPSLQLFIEKKDVAAEFLPSADLEPGMEVAIVVDLRETNDAAVRQSEWNTELARQEKIAAEKREQVRLQNEAQVRRLEANHIQDRQKARWLERREQLALFYRMNQPQSGADFDDFINQVLLSYSWAAVVTSITRRHPSVSYPSQRPVDVSSQFEVGMEPSFIREIIQTKAQEIKNAKSQAETEALRQSESQRQNQNEQEQNLAHAKLGYGVL
jgi:hypothetical protein